MPRMSRALRPVETAMSWLFRCTMVKRSPGRDSSRGIAGGSRRTRCRVWLQRARAGTNSPVQGLGTTEGAVVLQQAAIVLALVHDLRRIERLPKRQQAIRVEILAQEFEDFPEQGLGLVRNPTEIKPENAFRSEPALRVPRVFGMAIQVSRPSSSVCDSAPTRSKPSNDVATSSGRRRLWMNSAWGNISPSTHV